MNVLVGRELLTHEHGTVVVERSQTLHEPESSSRGSARKVAGGKKNHTH
jgi:hypothetical protein